MTACTQAQELGQGGLRHLFYTHTVNVHAMSINKDVLWAEKEPTRWLSRQGRRLNSSVTTFGCSKSEKKWRLVHRPYQLALSGPAQIPTSTPKTSWFTHPFG